ncbi:hypothetical protein VTK73DRAFT_1064 [Phialemonium thermophilum]|uniref:Protein kinase domain-containing protein n=1 Tax=Phialemonium thermophilum TaxID=223376 RepID=A0ABR3VTX9_9PEZI
MVPASMITFPPEAVLDIVKAVCSDGTNTFFLHGTEDRPLSGKQCLIYVVQGIATCAVRIPVHLEHLPSEAISNYVDAEVSILRRLETSHFSWSPRVLGYDSGFNNPIKFPYMVLTWIDGKPLEWTESIPPQGHTRDKVLYQLANILLELVSCTMHSKPGVTALTFLTDAVDRKIQRVKKGQLRDVRLEDCLVQRELVPRVIHDLPEASYFVLSHEDLAAQNIIVDDEFNVKGIIDWGFARYLPLQFAAYFPRFLAIEPEVDDPLPEDVVSFSSAFLRPSLSLQVDRECFISQLLSADSVSVSHAIRELMTIILTDPDVDWRHLVFEAAFSKGLHVWMAKRSWLITGTRAGLEPLSH